MFRNCFLFHGYRSNCFVIENIVMSLQRVQYKFHASCKCSAVQWCSCVSHSQVKPNVTVPAPTTNNIVSTQPLLSRSFSTLAQFNVNTNQNCYRRHRTTINEVNRNVQLNATSHSTCTYYFQIIAFIKTH